jgi:hypothetical protein
MNGKDADSKCRKVIKVTFRHLPAETEENHETSRSGDPVSGLIFELGTSTIRARRAYRRTAKLDFVLQRKKNHYSSFRYGVSDKSILNVTKVGALRATGDRPQTGVLVTVL